MATATGAPPIEQLTDHVRNLSSAVREATIDRDASIRHAHGAGATIAGLARAADLDVGTVRRILQRAG